jgi:hypothetical protein
MPEGQQELPLDYSAFSSPACNAVRKKNAPPEPDDDWLFDAAGVTDICGRRQCTVQFKSELIAEVSGSAYKRAAANPTTPAKMPDPIMLTATKPGRWHPVDILAACTKANVGRVYDVPANAVVSNPPVGDGDRLDEVKIARVVGADGLRPYLSKRGKQDWPGAAPGMPTWTFRCLLFIKKYSDYGTRRALREPESGTTRQRSISDYGTRRALRALEDVGLVNIKLGPRGRRSTARVTWTKRAMLPTQLSLYDHDAISEIAAGRL